MVLENFIKVNIPKFNLNINLSQKPIKLFGGNGNALKMKPIDFGPSFSVTSKQGLIKPIKQSGSIQAAKIASANKELQAAQQRANEGIAVENRVKGILGGGLALGDEISTNDLELSGIAKPTASKIRDTLRDQQRGLLNKPQSIFSNREFQVAFVGDGGTVQQKTFKDKTEAMQFRERVEAAGFTEIGSPVTVREVRV